MAKVIAVVTQKGGVGKTTTAVNLASTVAEMGKTCLLVDIDPQGNATSGVGLDKRRVQLSTYDLLAGAEGSDRAAIRTAFERLSIVPSSVALGVLMNRENTVLQAGGFIIQLMPGAEDELIDRLEKHLAGITSITSMLDAGMAPEDILKEVLGEFGLEIMDR